MNSKFEVSAVINFHSEDYFALPAIKSFKRMVEFAKISGIKIETIAILDKPSPVTQEILNRTLNYFDKIEVIQVGDIGISRNLGAKIASGEYICFFDGDDMWGENWIKESFELAKSDTISIWHPEWLYVFDERDFFAHSLNSIPNSAAGSFFMRQVEVDSKLISSLLGFTNVWSAHALAHNSIFSKYNYPEQQRSTGLGIEDWSWNIKTHSNGIKHLIVKDTVHLYRKKTNSSESLVNASSNLLPILDSKFSLWKH